MTHFIIISGQMGLGPRKSGKIVQKWVTLPGGWMGSFPGGIGITPVIPAGAHLGHFCDPELRGLSAEGGKQRVDMNWGERVPKKVLYKVHYSSKSHSCFPV